MRTTSKTTGANNMSESHGRSCSFSCKIWQDTGEWGPAKQQSSLRYSRLEAIPVELKNKIWMNGNLEWFAYLGDDTVFLGRREVPYPLREGDRWTNGFGDVFRIVAGEITREISPD